METKDKLLGQRFDHRHAAGVTRFQVDRAHRDAGYYECVAVRGVEGSHHFVGAIEIFSRAVIVSAIEDRDVRRAEAAPELLAALKMFLERLPECWGDEVRGGTLPLIVHEDAVYAAEAAIAKAEGR